MRIHGYDPISHQSLANFMHTWTSVQLLVLSSLERKGLHLTEARSARKLPSLEGPTREGRVPLSTANVVPPGIVGPSVLLFRWLLCKCNALGTDPVQM